MTSIQVAITTTSTAVLSLLFCQQGMEGCELSSSASEKESLEQLTSTEEADGILGSTVDFLWDQARFYCLSSGSNCTSWSVILRIIIIYLSVAVVVNLIACYKFISTWNLIVQERRLDLKGFVQRQQRLSLKEALKTHVALDSMTCKSCCICLSDFEENQLVTACDDGCHKWYHRECLFNWLDQSNDCPCCRVDMLSRKSKGLWFDLMEYLGYSE